MARAVASGLGFLYLDTGAMYRAVAWKCLQEPEQARTPECLAGIARGLALEIRDDGSVWLDGSDVTLALRDEAVGRAVHLAADNMAVREALVEQQRRLGSRRPSVLEGRDIATVVFPDARWKFYLDASADVRAERRVRQLAEQGRESDFARVRKDLLERDARDRSRPWGALRIAHDATLIDTTYLSQDRVVELILGLVTRGGETALPGTPDLSTP